MGMGSQRRVAGLSISVAVIVVESMIPGLSPWIGLPIVVLCIFGLVTSLAPERVRSTVHRMGVLDPVMPHIDWAIDWVIGIENPNLNKKLIKEIVNITNKGIATSGDYKNFYEENGVKYSHILNPNSGKPILHNTKSVTVIHNNAMMADGWATALLALGSNKGLKIAEKYKIASLFILKEKNNFIKIKSSEFNKLNKN